MILSTQSDDEISSTTNIIRNYLKDIAIQGNGFLYMQRAINLIKQDLSLFDGLQSRLYPKLAEEYDVAQRTITNVIGIAIKSAYRESPEKFFTLFECENMKQPDFSQITSLILDNIDLATYGNDKDIVISRILRNVGVSTSLRGYYLMREGVRLILQRSSSKLNLSKEIYPQVEAMFGIEPYGLFSAAGVLIDKSIKTAYKNYPENFRELFGYEKSPSNEPFLLAAAGKAKFELKTSAGSHGFADNAEIPSNAGSKARQLSMFTGGRGTNRIEREHL